MLISTPVALLDPYKELPAIEWQTRDRMYELARRFAKATGLHLVVRREGGRRTCAEQNAIFERGRTEGGQIVTYASGCTSWHVLGRAVDVDPIDDSGRFQPESTYKTAGDLWQSLGGKWGGYFPGFPDIGHFEWHPGVKIEQVCPDPTYCDVIEAGIQTRMPFGRYALSGVLVSSVIAGVGYGGWRLWQWWRQR
jgi:hypothetical protein